jgi:hypothetical protein
MRSRGRTSSGSQGSGENHLGDSSSGGGRKEAVTAVLVDIIVVDGRNLEQSWRHRIVTVV